MRVGTIGILTLGLVACAGEDPEIAVKAILDGHEVPDLSVGGPCRDASDCSSGALAACQVAVCQADGTCGVAAAADGEACDDGNPCTAAGSCAAGACVAGAAQEGACDDEDPCTPESSCVGGACVGVGVIACDDADPCTDDACEPGVGCVAVARVCPDPEGSPCERGVCDSASGACVVGPREEGEACDDGLPCSVGATCHDGACVGFVGAECDDDNPCTVDFCTAAGCSHSAVAGPCDDGNACTSNDACSNGLCVGSLMTCDDEDPCTADACVAGSCTFTPIADCVPPSPGCEGKVSGQACDDGDVSTVADLCAAGTCRGFTLTRVTPAGSGESQQLRRVSGAHGRWVTAMALTDTLDDAAGLLAEVSPAGAVSPYAPTRHAASFVDVDGDFAIDDEAVLWVWSDGQWSENEALRWALDGSGFGLPHGIWSITDANGPLRLWAVGEGAFGGPWIRRCTASNPTAVDASCHVQSVITSEDPVLRAVTGQEVCEGAACALTVVAPSDTFHATGADGLPRWFNDVYAQNGTVSGTWQVVAYDPGQSAMTSNAAAAVDTGGFIVVGGYGYMRTNAVTGLWALNPITVLEDQEQHHFEGVWSGDGVVVVASWRAVGVGLRRLELLVADSASDLREPANWYLHELGTESGTDAGVFDVDGAGGTWMVVGAGRSSVTTQTQGLVYVRKP